MENKIIDRILKEVGVPELFNILSEQLNPSDLQSLLLEVYRKRATKISPSFLLQQHLNNRFAKPSLLSPQVQLEFDRLAFEVAKGNFEPIILSPLAGLGTCSAIARADQNKIISTARNVEVTADPTNVMALESAIRRNDLLKKNAKSSESVHLCTSQRVTRAQFFDAPNSFGHFQIFALTSAGRDTGSFNFEQKSLKKHLDFYVQLMGAFSAFQFTEIEILVLPIEKKLELSVQEILKKYAENYPDIRFEIDQKRTNGVGYYQTLCFTINATNVKGEKLHLVDGGITDWTQKLMSNKKERLMISAIGSERVGLAFTKG